MIPISISLRIFTSVLESLSKFPSEKEHKYSQATNDEA